MKRALLSIVVPALLVALGFAQTPAQTPAASGTTDQTIKGCLAGSDGNYTVVEDNTGHIFKITTNSVDFKQHLGHDVTLIGRKASGASSGAADNSFTVTELNMISEHCAAPAPAPAATVGAAAETPVPPAATATDPVATTSSTVVGNVIPPDAAAPAATVSAPAETVVPPTAAAAAPATTSSPVAENAIPPDAASSAATVDTPAETVVTTAAAAPAAAAVITPRDKPAANATDAKRLPARSQRRSETSAAVVTKPAVTASTSAKTASTSDAAANAAANAPAATASTSSEPDASTLDAVATTPAATSRGRSLWFLIAFAVLVIVGGIMVPFLSRWRKRKSLERTGAPNLSFTREASSDTRVASSDQNKSDRQEPRKAA